MHALVKTTLTLVAAAAAAHASAELTAYEHRDFHGRSVTLNEPLDNFNRIEFNDRTSSLVVAGRAWEVCEDAGFRGRCMILAPGYYPSLNDAGMNDRISSAREVRAETRHPPERYAPALPPPQVTFYEAPGFQGRGVTLLADAADFRSFGFNDRASSVVVLGQPWEACEAINYGGRCVVLRPGRYPDLRSMGLGDRLSSVRTLPPQTRIDEGRWAPPPPAPAYDWRRRHHERLYEAQVIAVRAVYTTPQQRCWVERERVAVQEPRPEVGGAVVGGLLGGILGHQIGSGSGRDIATVGGAVVGAAIGARIAGRDDAGMAIQNVQRCTAVPPQGRPDYWDVTYDFRGLQHHLQALSPPGPDGDGQRAG